MECFVSEIYGNYMHGYERNRINTATAIQGVVACTAGKNIIAFATNKDVIVVPLSVLFLLVPVCSAMAYPQCFSAYDLSRCWRNA